MDQEKILVVTNDTRFFEDMQEVAHNCCMTLRSLEEKDTIRQDITENFCQLILLDLPTWEVSADNLFADIRARCPDTQIMIITDHPDRVRSVLHIGAFDVLGKPIAKDHLADAIHRALRIQELEREHQFLMESLLYCQEELRIKKIQLDQSKQEVIDANNAFLNLARHIGKVKKDAESQVILKIRSLFLPIIEKLIRDKQLAIYQPQLAMLIGHIEDLTSGLAQNLSIEASLSTSELRIASLVKHGMTSEEIAAHLMISPATVRTHRRNIRQKLKISGSQHSLQTHLQSLEHRLTAPVLPCNISADPAVCSLPEHRNGTHVAQHARTTLHPATHQMHTQATTAKAGAC